MRETTPQRTMRRDFVFKEKRKGQAELRALKAVVKQRIKSWTTNSYKRSMVTRKKKSTKVKTEMTRPVKRNTVIFLLREWVERKMEKTRAIVTKQLNATMESLVMRRETVMTAQSIGQVVESSIEVNEEPGSLINVLNVNILGLSGRERSKVGSVYVLSVATDVSGLRT